MSLEIWPQDGHVRDVFSAGTARNLLIHRRFLLLMVNVHLLHELIEFAPNLVKTPLGDLVLI